MPAASASARRPPARSRRTAPRRRAGRTIRWDRVGRLTLLAVLCGILALYVSPLLRWQRQTETANAQRAEVQRLQGEQRRLESDAAALESPSALDEQARQLGMVREGEVPLVIENLPPPESSEP
jgi:cell division protein FtsB